MKTRSWMALVMPITLTGLQALSVEIADHGLDAAGSCSRMARTMFSGPPMLVCTASKGKYSQVGTCFSAAALKTTSASRRTALDAVEVADVADPELQQLLEVAVDDLVGRHAAVQVVHAHVVLLGLVAREDDDLARARPARRTSSRRTSTLPSEPVPPVTTIRLSVSMFHGCALQFGLRRASGSSASSCIIAGQAGGRKPVACRNRTAVEAAVTDKASRRARWSAPRPKRVPEESRAGRTC